MSLISSGTKAAASLIAFGAVMFSSAVQAHVHLESSTPARDSALASSPPQVRLVFAEAVEVKSLTLSGTRGKATTLGPLPATDVADVRVPLPKLAAGSYVLTYTIVGSDLHEMKGTIPFRISGRN